MKIMLVKIVKRSSCNELNMFKEYIFCWYLTTFWIERCWDFIFLINTMFAEKYYTYLYYEPRRLFDMLCTFSALNVYILWKEYWFFVVNESTHWLNEHMVHSQEARPCNLLHSITKTNIGISIKIKLKFVWKCILAKFESTKM